MTYGLDNFIFVSSLSVLNSIILIMGIYKIGLSGQKFILKNFFSIKKNNYIYYYSFLVGIYIVAYFLYIITILQLVNFLTFKIIATTIYFLGLYTIIASLFDKECIDKLKNLKNLNYYSYIIFISLFGLILISLSPLTHSDALDYHAASAIKIMNIGRFDTGLLPMTSKLASIGELMIALGFSIKSEQFGALLQFSSLFSLIPIFLKKKKVINNLIFLLILLSPVTLFLISSPKPQLVQCVSTVLIFYFLLKDSLNYNKNKIITIFSIIFFILAINIITKYSFMVSSVILYSYCTYLMYKKKFLIELIFISLIIFFITLLPMWIHRFIYFETTFVNLLLSPLPLNIYGYQNFNILLTSNSLDIISLVFPKNFAKLSSTYGPILLLIFFIKKESLKKYKKFYYMTVLFVITHYFLGTNLPRFLYEGYLWFMLLLSISEYRISKYYKGYQSLLRLQILLSIFLVYIAAYTLFPGSLNQALRDKVMVNNANGYSLAKWVNENVDENNVILTTHRSISLYNNETYPTIFLSLIDLNNKDSYIYANYLKEKKIDRIVFFGNNLNTKPFAKCLGKELSYKKEVGKRVGRNLLNNGKNYDGWIYDFNYSLLPECLIR